MTGGILRPERRAARDPGRQPGAGRREGPEPGAGEGRCRDPIGGERAEPLPGPDPIDARDRERLAALHRESLPGSAVAVLGERYTERFYRYLAESETEHAFFHRDAAGVIDAACVVSLSPASLNRRLWRFTPLLASLLRGPSSGPRRAPARALSPSPRAHRYESEQGAVRTIDAPEIILVFVAPAGRRRGLGRALLARSRAWLRDAGHRRCLVRTSDSPRRRVAAFYRATGFELRGCSSRRGFQVWESRV